VLSPSKHENSFFSSLPVLARARRRAPSLSLTSMDILRATGYHMRPPHLVAQYKGFF